ncbi:MAG: homocysteine S-methyltransferase family protein [Ectothiorhodospiraceae bacterium]|nr:homocysteine S-methyltransferase family protein [Chromatiales bacterium]MCP5157067.1 homocysteine S-methyltransferase family protein [Ectothiorhodospiraceae bacterium]
MSKYRDSLPQGRGKLFITDGGLETTLVYHEGIDLPCFAAFDLLRSDRGRDTLTRYFDPYLAIARRHALGFVLESATWRASQDWGQRLGYSDAALAEANHQAVEMLVALRDRHECASAPMVVSGCVGPRGDGYDPSVRGTAAEAQAYHSTQIHALRDAGADMITALTMTHVAEAIGVTRAATAAGMPIVVSFTTEVDGRLPSGETLCAAVETVDRETCAAPVHYMINCAHPLHFADALAVDAPWTRRVRGLRANASTLSHAELDVMTELDAGDPIDLGARLAGLRRMHRHLDVLGGCCGTDHRHIAATVEACVAG